jgi:hypothetical protein
VDSVKTTFFPLTTPTGPVFYYIQILAKKGLLSERRGETNVVSVLRVFYYLQRGNRYPIMVTSYGPL